MAIAGLGLERRILAGRVNFPLCLAPMVGLSHIALRLVVRRYLPEGAFTIWPTEMLNSRRIPGERLGETLETLKGAEEVGLVPQILGNEEEPIRQSIDRLVEWGAEGVDINMGCPVKKALRHNYGVALMGDADYAAQVVAMAAQAGRVPVSVKLRAGITGDKDYLLRFAGGLQAAGAAWICLHPRLAEQKRRGNADWSQIRLLRENLRIPVIGNGDIQTADDVLRMLDETGCDMVMAGRALTARPWLFWQVGERLGWAPPPGLSGAAPSTPEEEGREMGVALQELLKHFRNHFPENLGMRRFLFLLRTNHVWLEFGHALYSGASRKQTYDEMHTWLSQFFASTQRMMPTTQLRY